MLIMLEYNDRKKPRKINEKSNFASYMYSSGILKIFSIFTIIQIKTGVKKIRKIVIAIIALLKYCEARFGFICWIAKE